MQDARAIANHILSNYDSLSMNITNLKINKIIYLVHGWYFARKNEALIRNHFEAWQYGPVIRVVFDSFSKFGDQPITEKALYMDHKLGKMRSVDFVASTKIDFELIKKITDFYIKYSASELVTLTHKNGSPWHTIFHNLEENKGIRDRIPNELIYAYFCSLGGSGKSH
ncbi:Panacea domain-containing protein [Methylobacterium marchantiae]|uniref:Panacea domain-containing protein n=1 Tax=Methylobacterium marchantiae TaxID=600331 RepID=A0ABW3WYX0_9HYPH